MFFKIFSYFSSFFICISFFYEMLSVRYLFVYHKRFTETKELL